MKIIILITLFPLYTYGQSRTDWDVKTDSLIQLLTDPKDQFWFNEILRTRTNSGFSLDELLDSSNQVIRLQEMVDTKTLMFHTNESYPEEYETWDYAPIDSIRPRNYYMFLGCLIKKHEPLKVKRWRRKIAKMDSTRETYYIIDTYIDKVANTLKISLRIPVIGKRTLKTFYGPTKAKPYLPNFYNSP